jgi:hypothetical protein
VTVSSITHRTVRIRDARAFLTDWRAGYYEYTKLANVYFAYELQRWEWIPNMTRVCSDYHDLQASTDLMPCCGPHP